MPFDQSLTHLGSRICPVGCDAGVVTRSTLLTSHEWSSHLRWGERRVQVVYTDAVLVEVGACRLLQSFDCMLAGDVG